MKEEKKVPTFLKNAREIKKWMQEHKNVQKPSRGAEDAEERRLAQALDYLERDKIRKYLKMETEEREAYRQKHPEIDEVLEIVQEINNNIIPIYLKNVREVRKWMQEHGNNKKPSQNSSNKEEKRLGQALNSIRKDLIKPYLILKTDEEREDYRQKHPKIDEVLEINQEIEDNSISVLLINARKINLWIEKHGGDKLPSKKSQDDEERGLEQALRNIIRGRIKPYLKLKTEEEKEEFRMKFPDTEEILELLKLVQEKNKDRESQYLSNARLVKEWVKRKGWIRCPNQSSKNHEERKLGNALSSIRRDRVKPYLSFQTDEEKNAYRQMYPEIDEILEIINEIDNKIVPPLLKNAREIREWIEKSGRTKFPSSITENPEEKRLAIALSNIRAYRIKPYSKLQTEEERKAFLEKYPDTDEVIQIITEIDEKNGRKRLKQKVEQDASKRAKLQAAKELEAKYEELLSNQNDKNKKQAENTGVDIDDK